MKRAMYTLSAIALVAGVIVVACNTPDKKAGAGKTTVSDTIAAVTTQVAKTQTKIDKNKVPKEVTGPFYADYPTPVYSDWYGYPAFDSLPEWYGYDPYLYNNYNPENYVVEFTLDSIPQKAVYTKAGKKIAIHRTIAELPKNILWAVNNGDYKTWTIDKEKEEIFKDKDSDKLKVYMVTVEKDGHKHILYFQSDRRLMKDKKVS